MKSLKALFSQQLSASGLPDPVQQVVSSHWQQFTDQHNTFSLPADKDHPAIISELIHCWAGSDFAAQQCIRHPQWLQELITQQPTLPALATSHSQRLENMSEGYP